MRVDDWRSSTEPYSDSGTSIAVVATSRVTDAPPAVDVPGELLRAIADRTGRVTIIVGAGCSLEAPTNLLLSSAYSKQVFDDLVADAELEPNECEDPWDLSLLASAVHNKFGDQAKVVERLPRNDFLYAQANLGYQIAAALLVEGSVACVATLNYDLALTDAVRQTDARTINQVAGPSHMADFGNSAIVYLHRNVNEQDFTKWILRKEALEEEWQEHWEGVVAARLAASPVVVFAGLGSPAAVLTETIRRVRQWIPNVLHAFLADPTETTAFAEALDLGNENHIRAGWGDFMLRLGERLALEFSREMRDSCRSMIQANGWGDLDVTVEKLCEAYRSLHLLGIGRVRSLWLDTHRSYEPDNPASREHLADLLLGIGLLLADDDELELRVDGMAVIPNGSHPERLVLPISGRGTKRWSQLDPVLEGRAQLGHPVEVVVAAGFQGLQRSQLSPPENIVAEVDEADLTTGAPRLRIVSIEDLRAGLDLLNERAS